VLSPLFAFAKRGIAGRESAAHRLAEEYVAGTGLDLLNGLSQLDVLKQCKKAFAGNPAKSVKGFRKCVNGMMELSEDPDWNEYARQWNGTFIESLIPEQLRFAGYESTWGTMYLLEHQSDITILTAIYETDLARSLLRMVPAGCVTDGGHCPYADTAAQLREVSRQIKKFGTQGYLVDASGRVLDANGLPIATPPPAGDLDAWAGYTVGSGLHDDLADLSDRLDRLYRQEFGVPVPPPALHLETHLAYRVAAKEVALRDNTLRLVMNNPGGVCDAVPPENAGPDDRRQVVAGCIQAVKLLLPAGTTMVIYHPDPEDPESLLEITVRGDGRRLD